jgi:putative endonuclease
MKVGFCVYILECSDATFYIGSTNNLEKRLREHNSGKRGAHYTKIRRPVQLRYFEQYENLSQTRKREAELKKLSRAKKIMLIAASKRCYTDAVISISSEHTMAKGNNSRKKEAKKPKKAKK